MPMGGPAPVAPTGPIAGPTAAAATAEPLALPAGFAPTAGDAGLGNFGPAGVTLGQRLAGKGPQGAGLLGRLGLGASEASDLGLLARLGNLQGLKGLGARAGLGFAVSAGGEALGEWIKSQDFAKQPLAPVTGTGPGGLPMAANVEEAQARVAPASGDVLGNMAKGAGIGGGLSAFLGPEAIPFGAAAGAGVAGIGTALNDIFGSGKENPPVAVQPAGMGEARTGPVPLRQLMGDMNLPDKYQSRVMDQYNDALTYAKAQGGIEVPDPSDPTGKKTVQLTDPAKIEQVVWRQAAQMVPLLKQQAAQEQQATEAQAAQHADFIRRTIMLQAGLAQAAPQLMNPAFFTVNPGERQQAMADIQAIPAMLAMGEQGDANRQLAGQIQSKQLAQLLGPTPEQANESAYQQLIAQRQRLAQAKQEHPELYPQSSSTSGADELLNPSNG